MSNVDPRLLESCFRYVSRDLETAPGPAAFLGSLIPVCLAVTLLSTPRLRKQWAFRLLVVALVVMLMQCSLKLPTFSRLYEYGREVVDYDSVYKVYTDRLYVGLTNAGYLPILFVPWICDCALLCRLLAFHPSSITPLKKRIAILAFPLAAHIPRLPLLIAYSTLWVMEGPISLQYEHAYKPLRVVEGGLQLLVNCYCSGFLLHKTHQYARADHAGQSAYSQQANRLRLRLRYMTESILFTFVPASLAQLGYFITAFVELYPPYKDAAPWTEAQSYMRLFVCAFSLYFGLLAVWWSNIRSLGDKRSGEEQLIVKSTEDVSLLDWALGPLAPEGTSAASRSSEEHQTSRSEKPAETCSEAGSD